MNLRESAPLNQVLLIDDKRMQKLMWMLDEIMNKRLTKAEVFIDIEQAEGTTTEKMLMTYMFAKRLMLLKIPMGERLVEMAGI